MKEQPEETLFEKLGGMPAVETAVDMFYKKVLDDSRLNRFFTLTDVRVQARKQKAFFAYAFGASSPYTGKSLQNAHAHLVQQGLTDQHFNFVIEHLIDTLNDMQVAKYLIKEVIYIVNDTRDDILGR